MPAATYTTVSDRVQTVLSAAGVDTSIDAHASDLDRLCGQAIVADSTAVTNTTDETDFDQTLTIPAGDIAAGRVVKIRYWVDIGGVTAGPDLALVTYYNGVAISSVSATSIGSAGGATFDLDFTCRTAGASGTFRCTGIGIATGASGVVAGASTAAGAVDTTVAGVLKVSAQWSAASASNTCTLAQLSYTIIGD